VVRAVAPVPLGALHEVHHHLVGARRAVPELGRQHELRRLAARKRVEDFLPQRHPVRGLHDAALAKGVARRQAPQHGVDDGQEVDGPLPLLPLLVLARAAAAAAVTAAACTAIVSLVVNLLELAQDDGRGDDAVAVVGVGGARVVKLPQRGDAAQHVLDGGVLVEVRQGLPVVEDGAARARLVLRQAAEVPRGDGEDGVEEVRVLPREDGHDELEVAVLVAEVELKDGSVSRLAHSCCMHETSRALPNVISPR